ncbi:hypothetical protein PHLGIDRAFT_380256 [Phlebiopsis gigantea 11061_1 CR5-6]|uniref:Uncharacterized protein n=1 Tax=Phlebiopsis gigantea (strain 11061_1 CR5-6) TaxID=745531 RepID=A0A0C3S9K8_PHLG1|nr:hypothetical protein PHLGIDRAFT_380256 [Phlebiopsis gigantea 11061_1 CR5-6]
MYSLGVSFSWPLSFILAHMQSWLSFVHSLPPSCNIVYITTVFLFSLNHTYAALLSIAFDHTCLSLTSTIYGFSNIAMEIATFIEHGA